MGLISCCIREQGKSGGERTRVCLLVTRKIEPNRWVHSKNLQTLQIFYNYKNTIKEIHIHNEKGSDTLRQLRSALETGARGQGEQRIEHVIVGDINLHHPAWVGEKVQGEEGAGDLIELTDNARMELWMEPR
jgi:Endonuclease-reverse transcriptase